MSAKERAAEVPTGAGLLIDSGMSSVDACLFADWREVAKHHQHLAEAYKARLARVEALADEWERESPVWLDPVGGPVTELRAAIAGDPA